MKVLLIVSAVLVASVHARPGGGPVVTAHHAATYAAAPWAAAPWAAAPWAAAPWSAPAVLTHSAPLLAAAAPAVLTHAAPLVAAPAPILHAAPAVAVPAEVSSQFHAQDVLGQFSFGHASATQSRAETKTLDGVVRGGYSYVDGTGKVNQVEYQADDSGFHVLSANNLPEGPVAIAGPALIGPEPVQDTPEVIAARAEHLAAVHEARSRQKRGIALATSPLLTTTYAAHAAPLAYTSLAHAPALAYTTAHHAPLLSYSSLISPITHHSSLVAYKK